MGHLLKFILDVNLELDNAFGVNRVLNLLSNFARLNVETSFKQALSVVQLVLSHVGVELRQLVIHVCGIAIVLNVEVAVRE